MGRVWRAADEMLDRQVAVKEMRIDGLDPEDTRTRRERTLREARATARIDHPGVVRIYDVVDASERLWIVMELVAGRSLERIVAEDGPLDPREAARVGLELVGALRQVHAGGVLHRDIKPGNVLVERAGRRRVVLTDFGIAALQDAEALTMAGMLVGSPDYMAPERISGRPQGPPSDVWSLGATLCAALGGRSPFSRATTYATLHAVLYEEPVLPAAAGVLRDILAALLEKEPDTRPGLEELETALEEIARPPAPGSAATRPLTEGPEYDFTHGVEFGPAYGRTRTEGPGRTPGAGREPDRPSAQGRQPGHASTPDRGQAPQRPPTPPPDRTPPTPPVPGHGPETPGAGREPGEATAPAPERGRTSSTPPGPDGGPGPARSGGPRSARAPGPASTQSTANGRSPAVLPGPRAEPGSAPASPPRSGQAPAVASTPDAGHGRRTAATPPSPGHGPDPAPTPGPRPAQAPGSASTPGPGRGEDPPTTPGSDHGPGPGYSPTVVSPSGPIPESTPAPPVREPDSPPAASAVPVPAHPAPSEPASAPAHDSAPGRRAESDTTPPSAPPSPPEPHSAHRPVTDLRDVPGTPPEPASEPAPDPSPRLPSGREPRRERHSPPQPAADAGKLSAPSSDLTDNSARPEADAAREAEPAPDPQFPAPAASPTRALLDARSIRATRLPADPEAPPAPEQPLSGDRAEGSSPAPADDLPPDGGAPAHPGEHPSVQDAVPVRRTPTRKSAPDFRKHSRARSAEGVPASGPEALTRDPVPPATANASTEAPSEPRGEPRSETPSQLPTAAVSVLPPRNELAGPAAQSTREAGSPPGSGEDTGTATGSGGRGGGRRLVVVATGLVVAGAVAGIVLALSGGGSPEDGSAASPGTSSAATASSADGNPTSASPTVEGTSRPPSLPPGAHREAGGYAWVTPKGWRRDLQTGSEVHYTSPDGAQELAAKSSLAKGNLMDTWQTSEQNARQGQDYRKIRLEETTFQGRPAIVWEYTFTIKGVGWHARLLGFDVDGKSYQINTWYHRDIEDGAVAAYNQVKKSFTVL
ncbi:protein kinase domain-containing protein [Streptomyces sp. 039-1]|uniref:serine/threonine-protein kinase n=1 Tax=Streptomyces sp. 039-1 TaxID=2789263 RepID=UPI0039F62C33